MVETVTIPKRMYEQLKRRAALNDELLRQFGESFDDIKHGRVKRVA